MIEERLKELRVTARCGIDHTIPYDCTEGLIDLAQATRPGRMLEIGSDRGVSTEVFLLFAGHVTVLDPWIHGEDRLEAFLTRVGHYPNLTWARGFSPSCLRIMPRESLDMVYIDAVHEYQPIIDDIQAAWPLVKPGGWIAGHDYWPPVNYIDIIPAIDGLFGKANVRTFADGSWLVRRPDKFPTIGGLE